jgi:hypothetical protein
MSGLSRVAQQPYAACEQGCPLIVKQSTRGQTCIFYTFNCFALTFGHARASIIYIHVILMLYKLLNMFGSIVKDDACDHSVAGWILIEMHCIFIGIQLIWSILISICKKILMKRIAKIHIMFVFAHSKKVVANERKRTITVPF